MVSLDGDFVTVSVLSTMHIVQNGVTPLLAAASGGRTDLVKFLCANGAEVNHRDCRGRTALFLAAECGDLATAQTLLAAGADIALGETGGATVLHAAAAAGGVGLMQLCIARGLSVSATDEVRGVDQSACTVAVRPLTFFLVILALDRVDSAALAADGGKRRRGEGTVGQRRASECE